MAAVNLLPLMLLLLLSVGSASGLRCLQCFDTVCSSPMTEECEDSQSMCAAASITVSSRPNMQWLSCADSSLCPVSGPRSFSISTSRVSALAQVSCCDTDQCNDNVPLVPVLPPGGALTCPGCDSQRDRCDPVICNGLENYCFKPGGPAAPWSSDYGCASEPVCSSTRMPETLFANYPEVPDIERVCEPNIPLQCDLCLDTCCSLTVPVSAPSGMKCVIATVKDPSGVLSVRRTLGSAPLCLSSLTQTFYMDETLVQVKCCHTDRCNSGAVQDQDSEQDPDWAPASVQLVSLCDGLNCSNELYGQLELLIQGLPALTDTCEHQPEKQGI